MSRAGTSVSSFSWADDVEEAIEEAECLKMSNNVSTYVQTPLRGYILMKPTG